MTDFITVTTKGVSPMTGQPKVFAVNVAHIVTVEPTIFTINISEDEAYNIEGCTIITHANAHHMIEIESRDPFDHVMFRIQKAGGVIDQTQVEVTS